MTTPPNIVLVTVDSLRADHCSFMGYERATTPALDSLASSGAAFTNAIAPGPSTPESMPVVFTGRPLRPWSTGEDLSTVRAEIDRHLSCRPSLPATLNDRGYTTAGFSPNPFTSRYFGFDRGFDHFQDFMDSMVRRRYGEVFERLLKGSTLGSVARLAMNFVNRQEAFKPWAEYYEEVREWIERADEPYFVWLHTMDAHIPYLPPRGYRSQSTLETYYANYRFWRGDKESSFDETTRSRLVTAYDDAVRYSDALVDRLTAELGDPVVIVHGDHGEAFGEHGIYGHEPYLFEENIHVPLVIGDVGETVVDSPVSLRRLPDLVESVAAERALSQVRDDFAVSRTHRGQRTAIRGRRWKYIADGDDGRVFDLEAGEQSPVGDGDIRRVFGDLYGSVRAAERESRLIEEHVASLDGC